MRSLYGVFGAVGTWADWERFFDRSPSGLPVSFAALAVVFPALWLVVQVHEAERAKQLNSFHYEVEPLTFALIIGAWLLSFVVTASLVALVLRRTERLRLWLTAHNWSVVLLACALWAVFALVRFTPLPFSVGSGALFAAYLGLLPIGIRLAQRAGGFPLMSAVLVGCVLVSTSMVVLLTGTLVALQP